MLEKLKVCMFSYIAFLRFLAKPVDAFEPNTPPPIPNIRLHTAVSSIRPPAR